jgi:hypothetical protein
MPPNEKKKKKKKEQKKRPFNQNPTIYNVILLRENSLILIN